MCITSKEQAEKLTRQAAAAIGKDVTNWAWSDVFNGVVDPVRTYPDKHIVFNPLSRLQDAYELEVALRMNVLYKPMPSGGVLLQITRAGEGGSIAQSLDANASYVAAAFVRMEVVTKFASLCAIMDEKVVP